MSQFKVRLFIIGVFIIGGAFFIAPLFSNAQQINETFFIDPVMEANNFNRVPSTLRVLSTSLYVYVENSFYDNLSPLQQIDLNSRLVFLGVEFDNIIYPKLRNIYGSEWTPGIDNDRKITILITNLKDGLGGFVDPANEQSRSINSTSNQREMIYLNSDIIFSDHVKSYLAHEFVHLIEYNQKNRLLGTSEEAWLSEALADYAPTALGYNNIFFGSFLEKRVNDFLSSPTDSLIDFSYQPRDFASVSLFIHFLAGHYGEDILKTLMTTRLSGKANIENIIRIKGGGENFDSTLSRWAVANYLNSSTQADGDYYKYQQSQFSFHRLHIRSPVQYSIFSDNEVLARISLKSESSQWIKITPGILGQDSQTLRLDFSIDSPNIENVPYIITDINGASRIKHALLSESTGSLEIGSFGTDVLSVVLIPTNIRSDGANFELSAFIVPAGNTGLPPTPNSDNQKNIADDVLIRAINTRHVYVIKGNTRRWIPSVNIFNSYGHLRWGDIIEVSQDILNNYQESNLIRYAADPRVYEVENGTTKRWLDITPIQFEASGRNWDAIYEVNQREFKLYLDGIPIS